MNSLLMRGAVNCVRGWTWLYTWRMSSPCRETRRAEIESDLWEFQCDAAEDHRLGSALHVLVRLVIGIPDDLGWPVEQGAVAGTLTQRSIALGARMVGAALFICTIWMIDADASRRRPAMAVAGGAVVFGQEIEGVMTTRAGNGPHAATSNLPRLTAGIVATVGISMLPQPAAQSPPGVTSAPTFEVASIKPNPAGRTGPTRTQVLPGGRYVATNMPIRLLIGQTYRVSSLRLVGGPSWIASEHFDINAKANGELFPSGGERPLDSALRALLADRFKLTVHTETRQLPIYALRVTHSDGRLGPNLTRSSTTDCRCRAGGRAGTRRRAATAAAAAGTGAAVRRSGLPGHAVGG